MANVSDSNLRNYTKNEDFEEGDVIKILNEGKWAEVDFSQAKDGSKVKKVFQLNILTPAGEEKEHTMNATSLKSLREKWGEETSAWVGKTAKITFVKQMSFGKLTDVLVLLPS